MLNSRINYLEPLGPFLDQLVKRGIRLLISSTGVVTVIVYYT